MALEKMKLRKTGGKTGIVLEFGGGSAVGQDVGADEDDVVHIGR